MKVLGKHNPLDEGGNVLILITDRRRGSTWTVFTMWVDICVHSLSVSTSNPAALNSYLDGHTLVITCGHHMFPRLPFPLDCNLFVAGTTSWSFLYLPHEQSVRYKIGPQEIYAGLPWWRRG